MTEEKKQEETIWEAKEYVGKELKKKGSKDGKDWELWTLKFATGGQYPFTLSCFGNLGDKEGSNSNKIADLEEGEWYKYGYNLKKDAFEAHGKSHNSRTCFFMQKTTEEEAKKEQSNSNQQGNSSGGSNDTSTSKSQPLNREEIDALYARLQGFHIKFQKHLADAGKEDEHYNAEQFMSSAYLYFHKYEAKTVWAYWNSVNDTSGVKEEEKEIEKKEKSPEPTAEEAKKEKEEINELAKNAVKGEEMVEDN